MIKIGGKNASDIVMPNGEEVQFVYYDDYIVWAREPEVAIFEESTSVYIPPRAAFIDIVMIGGGASGQTGNGSNGRDGAGGESGWWYTDTVERGVDIPWSTNTIHVVIGAGGGAPPDSDHAHPTPGGATTVTLAGYGTLTAEGGFDARWNDNGGGQPNRREGEDPSTLVYREVDYHGGVGGRSSTTAATAPGAGGYGGGGGFIGSRSRGRPGARGQVWLTYRSYDDGMGIYYD